MREWKLPVRDRILIHLFDFLRFRDSFESPFEVTQAGIAEAVGIRPGHASQYLRPLVEDGMVEDETRHIPGQPRRRKAYFLTPKGRQWVVPERAAFFKETVPFKRTDGEVERIPLQEIYRKRRRGDSLLQLVQELASMGFLTEAGGSPESDVVDFSQEIPPVRSFHGREAAQYEVLDALEDTPLVVVQGMAGMGKTALGSKICEGLRGERSLFWRRIRPWDTAFDLASRVGVFLEALGRPTLHRYLSGSKQRSLGRVEDLLAADLVGLRTLLVFDDVHVASEDAETLLALLWNAVREVGGSSILLLSRTRPRFYSRRAVELEGAVFETVLRPLDRGSGESLLAEEGVPPDARGSLYEMSGGNPLFLKLIAQTGTPLDAYHGRETLHAFIAEEVVPHLDEAEHGCLQAASLFELPVPSEALLLEGRADLGTVIGLQGNGLLDAIGDGRVLLHDSLREYFRRGLPRDREDALKVRVVPWLLQEADRAEAAQDGNSALAFLGNALLLDDVPGRRTRSLEKVGDLRRGLGDLTGAVEAFRQALEGAAEEVVQTRLHRKVAGCLVFLVLPEEARREVETGLELAGREPSIEGAWLLSTRALVRMHSFQDYAGAMGDVDQALDWLPSLPEDLELEGMLESQKATLHYLDPKHRDLQAVERHFEATLACAEAQGSPDGIAAAHRVLATTLLERGDLEGAKRHLEEAGILAEEMGEYLTVITHAWFLAECLGEFEEAEERFERGFEMMRESDVREHLLWYDRLLADLRRRQERYAEARESLGYFLERGEGLLNVYRRVENLALMARVCLRLGHVEEGERYIREAEGQREGTESQWLEYHIAWARGLLDAAKGDIEQADARFRLAPEPGLPEARQGLMFEILGTLFQRGEFLLDRGQALAAAGRKDRAAELLQQAREELGRAGRRPLERRAAEALRALDLVASPG